MTMNNSARTSDWIGQVKGGVIYAYDLGSVAFGSNIKWLDLTQVPTRRERQAPVVRHLLCMAARIVVVDAQKSAMQPEFPF